MAGSRSAQHVLSDDAELPIDGVDDVDLADADARDNPPGGLDASLERRGQPQLETPHESTTLFSERLRKLAEDTDVRIHGAKRVRKLTPLRLQKLLKQQSPELPVSQTQIYRYYHGEAPPRLDVVFELARLFDVSPRLFADRTGAERLYSAKPTKPAAAAVDAASSDEGELASAELLVRRSQPQLEPPHVSTTYFARELQKLAAESSVRLLDGSDRVRKLSPLQLQKFLKEQAPDLPVSQTQTYRYYHGEASPRLDVVFELADLFGVSPTVFLPEWYD